MSASRDCSAGGADVPDAGAVSVVCGLVVERVVGLRAGCVDMSASAASHCSMRCRCMLHSASSSFSSRSSVRYSRFCSCLNFVSSSSIPSISTSSSRAALSCTSSSPPSLPACRLLAPFCCCLMCRRNGERAVRMRAIDLRSCKDSLVRAACCASSVRLHCSSCLLPSAISASILPPLSHSQDAARWATAASRSSLCAWAASWEWRADQVATVMGCAVDEDDAEKETVPVGRGRRVS